MAAGKPDESGAAEAESGPKVTLVADSGEKFEITAAQAKLSDTLAAMIEDADEDEHEFPVVDVDGKVLEKLVEYLKKYTKETAPKVEKPLKDRDLFEAGFPKWDAEFIEVEKETLFGIILAANSLNIAPLMELACAKVATKLYDRSIEEMKMVYADRIVYSPEDEAAMAEEDRWISDDPPKPAAEEGKAEEEK